MNKYKIIFVRNEVIACDLLLSNEVEFSGVYYYEHNRGNLIFAIIKADSVLGAINIADNIIKEVNEVVFGTLYN
ncbi:MAG: hypothetical protein K0Q79_3471 [Flavipsychrobacter sp.]|jgi:hypothetical protein|nr:hypothetical protein [Flavipsychrobacter sp.]